MIFYRGVGFVVIIWAAVCIVAAGWIDRHLIQGVDKIDLDWWIIGLSSLFFCIPNFWVGKKLNANGNHHHLMFIPVQYWSFVHPILLIVMKYFPA